MVGRMGEIFDAQAAWYFFFIAEHIFEESVGSSST